MTGRLMRRVLALPAPLMRYAHTGLSDPWIHPSERQINGSHPTGWLAKDPLLSSFRHALGEVHYCRSGSTGFAVGTEGATPQALEAWAQAMRAEGVRRTLVFPVAEWEAQALEDTGFGTMHVGEEAEIYLPQYSLQTPGRSNVRRMVRRAQKQGLRVSYEPAVGAEGHALQDAWRATCAQPKPMHFLVGSGDPRSPGLYVVVRCPEGRMVAWLGVRSGYRGEGYGVDDMVRAPDAPAGAMELAIDFLARTRRRAGDHWLSLGAVPLKGVDGRRPLLGPVCIALRETQLGNRLFGFSGLARFKAKFEPRWRPLYMADYRRMGLMSLYEGCRLWGLF